MSPNPQPVVVSDRFLPPEFRGRVEDWRFVPYPGERKTLRKRQWIPPSEWAPRHRVVTVGPRQGLWRNETTPYVPPVMDAMALPFVETVVLCWPPQCGKSAAISTFAGWLIDRRPGDMLFVYPKEGQAREKSEVTYQAMITGSRRLSEYLTGYADDLGTERIRLQHLALYFGWAGSAASLADRSLPYVFFDETDKYPETSGKKEAGPIDLGKKRATAFRGRRKYILASTPTIPSGPIWQALSEVSAVFVYWVRCPLCGHWQRMELSRIRVPEGERDTKRIREKDLAWYECGGCSGRWDDAIRDAAVGAGQWRHREKGIEMFTYLNSFKPSAIGFHGLPSWNSPFVGLSEVMGDWFDSQGDTTKLKDFMNAHAAEPWVIHEKEREEEAIQALADDRPAGMVPSDPDVFCLFGTADSQDNGFWYEIRAWARGQVKTSWGVRRGFVTSLEALRRVFWEDEYRDASGRRYKVRLALIDSGGHRTAEVYEFCRLHRNKIFPTKGERTMRAPVAWSNLEYFPGKQKTIPGGLKLVRMDTTLFKDELASRLEVAPGDPGAWMFDRELTEEWARHMVAEVKEKGVWVERDGYKGQNHGWDCSVLQLVCWEIFGLRYKRRKKRPEPEAEAPEEPAAAAEAEPESSPAEAPGVPEDPAAEAEKPRPKPRISKRAALRQRQGAGRGVFGLSATGR